MKKMLLTTSALAISGLVAVEATAIDVELYGQVNKAAIFYDDGDKTNFGIVDNAMSGTRFGLKGAQALDNGLTASVLIEGQLTANTSYGVTQSTAGSGDNSYVSTISEAGNSTFSERHARAGLAGDFGAIFFGKQSTATDSVANQDLVGGSNMMHSTSGESYLFGYKAKVDTVNETANGQDLVLGYAGGVLGGINADGSATTSGTIAGGGTVLGVGRMMHNFDGGRQNAVRYDSPILNGFQARVAAIQGGNFDMALYYSGKFDAFKIKAGLGHYIHNDTSGANSLDTRTMGSFTVKHDSGLGIAFTAGQVSLKNKTAGVDEPEAFGVRVGYTWDAFAVSANYGVYENGANYINGAGIVTDHEVTNYGIGGQYTLGSGVSLGATYHTNEIDVTGVDVQDVDYYGMNMRVKF